MTGTSSRSKTNQLRPTAAAALSVIAAVATGACSPAPAPTDSSTQLLGAEPTVVVESTTVHPPQVVLPDGFQVTLELAITPDELAQGLMFRPKLATDRGMLLIFAEERLPNIWMMNTLVALDLVYLDHTGTVVDIVTDAQPCPGEPCPRFIPKKPARAVLEVPAGTVGQHDVRVGATLDFSEVPGFPAEERDAGG